MADGPVKPAPPSVKSISLPENEATMGVARGILAYSAEAAASATKAGRSSSFEGSNLRIHPYPYGHGLLRRRIKKARLKAVIPKNKYRPPRGTLEKAWCGITRAVYERMNLFNYITILNELPPPDGGGASTAVLRAKVIGENYFIAW